MNDAITRFRPGSGIHGLKRYLLSSSHLLLMVLLTIWVNPSHFSTLAFVPTCMLPAAPSSSFSRAMSPAKLIGTSELAPPPNHVAFGQPISLFSNPSDDNDDNFNDEPMEPRLTKDEKIAVKREEKDSLDPILILPIATLFSIFLLFCFVLYTELTNPMTDFDIDFYMALDDVQKSTTAATAGSGGMMNGGDYVGGAADTIVGLPKLSPAEQLVGALFGPPQSPKY